MIARARFFYLLRAAVDAHFFTDAEWVHWAEKLIMRSDCPRQWVIDMSYFRGKNSEIVDFKASTEPEIVSSYSEWIFEGDFSVAFLYIKYIVKSNEEYKFLREGNGASLHGDQSFSDLVKTAKENHTECLGFLKNINDNDFLEKNKWIYDQSEE